MSHTKRFYNYPNYKNCYHPYKWVKTYCSCSYCIEPDMTKRRRERYKRITLLELWGYVDGLHST